MRRKPGTLTPLEAALISYAKDNPDGFWGWQFVASHPQIPNPSIYRALRRLERSGKLMSQRRDATEAYLPSKRIYRLKPSRNSASLPNAPEPLVVWQPPT